MHVVHAHERPPAAYAKSIFLEGPTPRGPEARSWRGEAIAILARLGYDGVVFVPEAADGVWRNDYNGQVLWEQEMRSRADVILAWVPRKLPHMPAFITNVEFGKDHLSGRFVYGRPPEAEKTAYLDLLYRQCPGETPCDTLEETLRKALGRIGPGAPRIGGATQVPLLAWSTPMFQDWLAAQEAAGNRLDGAEILHVRMQDGGRRPFSFVLHVQIWVGAENRLKSNEIVFFRPDICTVVALHGSLEDDWRRLDVVLVREFRSTVRNRGAMVLECPSGSSTRDRPWAQVAAAELREEAGVDVSELSRFLPVAARQLAATVSPVHAHCFVLHLTPEELARARQAAAGGPLGLGGAQGGGSSERTFVDIRKVGDLLDSQADWATLGMIWSACETLRGRF